jgi:hypothetical protein
VQRARRARDWGAGEVEGETGDRRQVTGDRRQETGDRGHGEGENVEHRTSNVEGKKNGAILDEPVSGRAALRLRAGQGAWPSRGRIGGTTLCPPWRAEFPRGRRRIVAEVSKLRPEGERGERNNSRKKAQKAQKKEC